jgi:hypothetical protein
MRAITVLPGQKGSVAPTERYRIHPEYLVAVDPALGTLGVLNFSNVAP